MWPFLLQLTLVLRIWSDREWRYASPQDSCPESDALPLCSSTQMMKLAWAHWLLVCPLGPQLWCTSGCWRDMRPQEPNAISQSRLFFVMYVLFSYKENCKWNIAQGDVLAMDGSGVQQFYEYIFSLRAYACKVDMIYLGTRSYQQIFESQLQPATLTLLTWKWNARNLPESMCIYILSTYFCSRTFVLIAVLTPVLIAVLIAVLTPVSTAVSSPSINLDKIFSMD